VGILTRFYFREVRWKEFFNACRRLHHADIIRSEEE
jgi:hypothetical protein